VTRRYAGGARPASAVSRELRAGEPRSSRGGDPAPLPRRERLSAGEIASTEYVTVSDDAPLGEAAQLMREHEVSHVVVTGSGNRPIGVLSTLDIAGTLAWGEA
jgi:hypothetical protein